MKRLHKIFASLTVTVSLLVSCMVPAFAATVYSTKYSTKTTVYSNYTGRTIYYYYQTPSTSTPSVTIPAKPTTPSTTPSTPSATTPTTPSSPSTSMPSTGLAAEESKMVSLVNQARMGQGLAPLSVNSQLTALAQQKSQDMVANNYFSHTSPTYGSPFQMMKNAGITYSTAGENIAGAQTTEAAHQNLMNSEGHRANILNPKFTEIGIGIASGSVYGKIFTQMFIGR